MWHVSRAPTNTRELSLRTDRLGKFAKPAALFRFRSAARKRNREKEGKKQSVIKDIFPQKDLEVSRAKGYPDGISFAVRLRE